MSNPSGPEWSDPTQAATAGYSPNPDPAYSTPQPGNWGPAYYGPSYTGPIYGGPPYGGPMTQPTEQFPTYWQPGAGYPPPGPPPPPQKKSPRWLWILASAAVLLVGGLVLALMIVTGSSRDSTVAASLTQTPSATAAPRAPITTTARPPIPTATDRPAPTTTERPVPTSSAEPATPVVPGEITEDSGQTETVFYSVTGEGRAINITYVDTGGVMQTEFNVALPWSKEVNLAVPAKSSASVAIINVGRDVTCSVSVDGAQVRQRTGRGLTICTGVA